MTFSAFRIRPSTDETGARHQGRCLSLNERQTIFLLLDGWLFSSPECQCIQQLWVHLHFSLSEYLGFGCLWNP